MASRVRVYCATSLDGFLAGPDDDISWLPADEAFAEDRSVPGLAGSGVSYEDFIGDVGALLMGRRTWDVFVGFDMPWPYDDRPGLVATHRPLGDGVPEQVRAVEGTVEEVVAEALEAAGGRDVWVDGGILVRQALDAGLVDEVILTLVPTFLGRGIPLAAGTEDRHPFRVASVGHPGAGLVQLRLVPEVPDA